MSCPRPRAHPELARAAPAAIASRFSAHQLVCLTPSVTGRCNVDTTCAERIGTHGGQWVVDGPRDAGLLISEHLDPHDRGLRLAILGDHLEEARDAATLVSSHRSSERSVSEVVRRRAHMDLAHWSRLLEVMPARIVMGA